MHEYALDLNQLERNEIKSNSNDTSTSAFSFPFTIPLSMLNSDVCGSPVVEVHDGLEGVPSPRGDVSLKAGKQRGHDVHAVLLTLPVREHSCIETDRRPASSCVTQK